jgi:hypothetical protein
MSDIFSLNGCYLDSPISCSSEQLCNAKTLLGYGNNNRIQTEGDGTCSIQGATGQNAINVRNELSIIQATAVKDASAISEKNTKRSVQINTYYAKKHDAQNYILKVIYVMVLVVAIMWAVQTYTSILPDWFFSAGMSITIGVCSIIIIFKSLDITNRSNFDYEQKISSIKNLPPLGTQDSPYSPSDQASAQTTAYNKFGKSCQNGECCPKFFSFNPSLGYCSFNPF